MTPDRRFRVDRLEVQVHPSAREAGCAMAEAVAARLRALAAQAEIAVAFASAPSQDPFLEALVAQPGVPWGRLCAFHLDEYIGLAANHPSSLATFLRERLAGKVPLRAFHTLHPAMADADAEAARYGALLRARRLALSCIGIGENGHLAFNDPHAADPDDPLQVKRVALDLTTRRQQVFDGAFPRVEDVPPHALTLTLPSILAAEQVHAIVPGARKAIAVRATLEGPVGTACPATALRSHPHATLYLDRESAALLSA